MELTIEQYVKKIYTVRSDLDETMKHNIEIIHSEVVDRITFEIPLYHVNAYDINSCIVPLNGKKYHHIIDHSTFDYFLWFLKAYEGRQPNLSSAIYSRLRHDVCMSQHDETKAAEYNKIPIYYTQYDMEVDQLRKNNPIDLTERFAFIARFYFLHEYCHFLFNNPIRKKVDFGFDDYLIDLITDNMINHAKSLNRKQNSDGFKHNYYISMMLNYRKEYHTNANFREEILCDIQSIYVLLEFADDYSVKMIFESVLAFIYSQYFIWLAKRVNKDIELGNIFHFRISVLIHFAYMLEDEDFSNIICRALNENNRFLNLTDIRCEPLDLDIFTAFYDAYTKLLMLDRQNKLVGNTFTRGFDSDTLDISNLKPNTAYMFIKKADGSYKHFKLDTPYSKKRRLEKLHNNALKEVRLNGKEYLDYLSLKGGGVTLVEIEKYYKRMYKYIKKYYPNFFEAHPSLINTATTTTLFIWEKEGRLFI